MKTRIFIVAFLLLCGVATACSLVESTPQSNARNSNQAIAANKDLVDQAADAIFGTEKTGIAECDEAVVLIDAQIKEQGKDSLAARVALEAVKQQLLARVREDVNARTAEERRELAGYCGQIIARTKSGTVLNNK